MAKRSQMICISLLEIASCHTEVRFVGFRCLSSDGGFVHNVGWLALIGEWTLRFDSAITVSWFQLTWSHNSVMNRNLLFYAIATTIADFHCVSIEDLVQLMSFRKVAM